MGQAKSVVMPLVHKNKSKKDEIDTMEEFTLSSLANNSDDYAIYHRPVQDPAELIYEIREYDVPFHVRVAIDKSVRVGQWYQVEARDGNVQLTHLEERKLRADPVVLAFDIETTKDALQFPDASKDQIMMISYMIDGEGFLITNRDIVSEDIDDFEYTPKPEFPGMFTIFNEENERALIERFFQHVQEAQPSVIATFNGDFFDWPFVETRAQHNGLDMYAEIGFKKDSEDEYKSAHCCHMDCFRWVKRDSYLPQGSQGLKAVTSKKLGYNPIELHPELMTRYAVEYPQTLAEYSVSDAVATYYLYMKYVHPFVFSLCNIIPLNPDETLRKGTGTLCEMLLMVKAFDKSILLPNKYTDPPERFYNGHLVETETYVGGHVESLETGVFRNDLSYKFSVDPTVIDELLGDLDKALQFFIEVEEKKKLEDVTNYDEVKEQIKEALLVLQQNPERFEKPSIYHVDVASMYPNIMVTNRLQPDSMITEEVCASCDFNRPGKDCDRRLPWSWRGEYYPPSMEEYRMIRQTVKNSEFPALKKGQEPRSFKQLSVAEQAAKIKQRVKEYSRKNYNRLIQTETVEREAIICQRENPFYVNTVDEFRERRYYFKGEQKRWANRLQRIRDISAGKETANDEDNDGVTTEDAAKMIVVNESMQLAHKVILNSFYGYVMRKGSRWYSMEMAGVTCLTGATIIQMARTLVERLGRPLELDTDGIWCILPGAFPENFKLKLKNKKELYLSYPCAMLNHLVHAKFTNTQYQTLQENGKYEVSSQNSIFFEVDGPYKAMILPTSKEEDKGLKKRYAVFDLRGKLSELKGFELKRRGELKLIKTFQQQVFTKFLEGTTLQECYAAAASVANDWLDVLETKAISMDNEELLELISENKSMSKSLKEYEGQKSTSITTARRLAEFLGEGMVSKAGLNCQYIIADRPHGAPVTERAIPVAIFSADPKNKQHYLRLWLKEPTLTSFDVRAILDWSYYWDRLGSTIQKIITIPAGYQDVDNPVPRLPNPSWLQKRMKNKRSGLKQRTITGFFKKDESVGDIEDIGTIKSTAAAKALSNQQKVARVTTFGNKRKTDAANAQPLESDEAVTLSGPAPSIEGEYSEWLKHQKKVWKMQKLERARRRQVFGAVRASTVRSTGIAGMMQRKVEKIYSNQVWNIVQLAETDRPGEIRASVAINGQFQNIRINVPRVIYINLKFGFNVAGLKRRLHDCKIEGASNMFLPDGSKSSMLYKLTMSEDAYLKESVRPDSVLKDPLVEGVYETNIDTVQNAILDLGLACTLDDSRPGLLGRGLESGFDLKWLIPCGASNRGEYLDSSTFYYIHVLHMSFGGSQIIAIVPTWSSTAHVLVFGSSAQGHSLPNIGKLYSAQLSDRKERQNSSKNLFEYPETINFEESRFTSFRRMCSNAGKILEGLQSEHSIKTIVVLQSSTPERIKGMIRTINDFPICEIRATDTSTFPALGWQPLAAKRIVSQFFGLNKWLVDLHGLAKYGGIPLCNFKWDDMRYLIDVSYARQLRAANFVLWWSSSPLPDEGGKEKDSMALIETESRESPIVNNPGCYTSVCLDLSIKNLAVNTILTSSLLTRDANTDSTITITSATDGTVELPFVEGSFSAPAMALLSRMVKNWWNDALREDGSPGSTYSESIINHLLSWISSRDSYMYHRILYQHVHNLSQKAFVLLVQNLRVARELKIVYADQTHIVLLTSKAEVAAAYSHANYIVREIRKIDKFSFLEIGISQYWSRLVWMDNVNYGGLGCPEITAGDVSLSLEMNWDIQGFLPPVLAEEFDGWVAKFIELVDDRIITYSNENHASQHPQTNEALAVALKGSVKSLEKPFLARIKLLNQRQQEATSIDLQEAIEEQNSDLISIYNDFKQIDHPGNMITALNQATEVSKMHGGTNIGSKNGVSVYNQSINRNMVLQLVKFVAAVFSLAKSIELEVQLFRRHLLQLFDIKEFSAEGNFSNPTASLKVQDLVCDFCGEVEDVDLCRGVSEEVIKQSQLVEVAGAGGLPRRDFGKTMPVGACSECGHHYNKLVVEEVLIQQVHKLLTQYQVQDLRCLRCKKIREDDMSMYCPCSGEWVETLPRSEIQKKIAIYLQLAQFYGMPLLHRLVDELL